MIVDRFNLRLTRIVSVAVACLLLAGCKKKEQEGAAADTGTAPAQAPGAPKTEAAAAAPAPNGFPGAAEVRAALKSGDYQAAVEKLIALKPLAIGDAYVDYRELNGEVGLKLQEAAKTDPKANEALATYRASLLGR